MDFKILIIILLSLVGVVFLFNIIIGIISFKVFKDVFYRKECKSLLDVDLAGTHYEKHLDVIRSNITELKNKECKIIEIKNDGLLLKARFYDLGSNNTVIMCHGYQAESFNNFHASFFSNAMLFSFYVWTNLISTPISYHSHQCRQTFFTFALT